MPGRFIFSALFAMLFYALGGSAVVAHPHPCSMGFVRIPSLPFTMQCIQTQAVAHAAATATTDRGTSFTSGRFTPAPGELLVVFVSATRTLLESPTLTSSIPGVTFSLAGSAVFGGGNHRLYAFIADQGTRAESQTVTFDCTGDESTGVVINVERVSGIAKAGLAALAQGIAKAENANSDEGTTVTFAAPVRAGSLIIGASSANVTTEAQSPPGLATLGSASHIAPGHRGQTAGRASGFVGATITWPAIGGTSSRGVIFLEIGAAPRLIRWLHQQ